MSLRGVILANAGCSLQRGVIHGARIRHIGQGVVGQRFVHRGQPEIDKLRLAAAGDENIAHLQIAMRQPALLEGVVVA